MERKSIWSIRISIRISPSYNTPSLIVSIIKSIMRRNKLTGSLNETNMYLKGFFLGSPDTVLQAANDVNYKLKKIFKDNSIGTDIQPVHFIQKHNGKDRQTRQTQMIFQTDELIER